MEERTRLRGEELPRLQAELEARTKEAGSLQDELKKVSERAGTGVSWMDHRVYICRFFHCAFFSVFPSRSCCAIYINTLVSPLLRYRPIFNTVSIFLPNLK